MLKTPNNIEVLDEQAISSLHELLEDDFLEIISDFIHEIPKLIDSLKPSSQSSDLNLVADITHSIKGASGNIGASYLSSVCETLESGLRGDSIKDPADYITEIVKASEITVDELQKRFNQVS